MNKDTHENRTFVGFKLPDLLTSLLYASAVSCILANGHGERKSLWAILQIIFVIVLIFSDWNSRILIPRNLESDYGTNKNNSKFRLWKIILEVCSMVTFVEFSKLFIQSKFYYQNFWEDNIYLLFSVYLFLCTIWNTFMINYMKIGYLQLWRSIFLGNTIGIDKLRPYMNGYYNIIETKLKNLPSMEMKDEEDTGSKAQKAQKIVSEYKNIKIWADTKRLLFLGIGNHLLWVSLVIGVIILLKINLIQIIPSFEIYEYSISAIWVVIILCVLLGLWSIFKYKTVNKENEKKDNVFKMTNTLLGISFIFLLLSLYLILPIYWLIVFTFVQQIFISFLIEYITDNGKMNI